MTVDEAIQIVRSKMVARGIWRTTRTRWGRWEGMMPAFVDETLVAEVERLRDIVRMCRKQMRELDVGLHLMQSWPDFCADTERLIAGNIVAEAARGKTMTIDYDDDPGTTEAEK